MGRIVLILFLVGAVAAAQEQPSTERAAEQRPALTPAQPRNLGAGVIVVPAGTRIPMVMKHAISTKSAREGDGIYLETVHPVVIDDQIVIPEGTYVQGKVVRVKRPGKVKGRGEFMLHLTMLVMPRGYMVQLPGAVDSVAGSERGRVKDEEGTVQNEGQKGRDAATVVTGGLAGAGLGGAATGSAKGAGIGAGAGALAGLGAVLLTRGSDLRIEAGSVVETELKRDLVLDAERVEKEVGILNPNFRRITTPQPPPPQEPASTAPILNPTGPR